MARRIPWWAGMLAFAVAVGGGLAVLAYLRGRASDPTAFCTERLPRPELLARFAEHPLRPVAGNARRIGHCEIYFVHGSAREVLVTRRAPDDHAARLRVVEQATRLPPVPHGTAAIFETTVQATKPVLIAVTRDGTGTLEISFDPAVFDGGEVRELLDAIAAPR